MESRVNNPACFGVMDGNNDLTHHGILGQKWGVRRGTSYPLNPEQYSASEKKGLGLKAKFAERKEVKKKMEANKKRQETIARRKKEAEQEKKKQERIEKRETRKAAKVEKKQAKINEWKRQIIDDGDVEALNNMKKKDLRKFTNEELQEAEIRYKQLNEIKNAKVDATIAKVSKIADKTKKVADIATNAAVIADKGVAVWNTVAKINNTLGGKPMKIIGEKEKEGPGKYSITESKKLDDGTLVNVKYNVDSDSEKKKLMGFDDLEAARKRMKDAVDKGQKVLNDSKPTESKPTESKPTESKPTGSKPTESKPTESKPTESKPTESKPSGLTPKFDEDGKRTSSDAQRALERLKEVNDMTPSEKRLYDTRSTAKSSDAQSVAKWLDAYNKEEVNKAKRKTK